VQGVHIVRKVCVDRGETTSGKLKRDSVESSFVEVEVQGSAQLEELRRALSSLRKGGRDRYLLRYEQLKLEEEIERVQGVHRAKWPSFEGTTRRSNNCLS
jgi:hypothetical protein